MPSCELAPETSQGAERSPLYFIYSDAIRDNIDQTLALIDQLKNDGEKVTYKGNLWEVQPERDPETGQLRRARFERRGGSRNLVIEAITLGSRNKQEGDRYALTYLSIDPTSYCINNFLEPNQITSLANKILEPLMLYSEIPPETAVKL